MHVSAWTVNDADTAVKLYDMGVSSIITDYPADMIPVVKALEKHNL